MLANGTGQARCGDVISIGQVQEHLHRRQMKLAVTLTVLAHAITIIDLPLISRGLLRFGGHTG